jgi:hypothetical protein
MRQRRNAQNEANRVQDIRFSRTVEAGNGIELWVPLGHNSACRIGLETFNYQLLNMHLFVLKSLFLEQVLSHPFKKLIFCKNLRRFGGEQKKKKILRSNLLNCNSKKNGRNNDDGCGFFHDESTR